MSNEVSILLEKYFNDPHSIRNWSIVLPLINCEEIVKEVLVFSHKRGNEMYESALNVLCACEELVISLLENEWDFLSEEDKELLIHSIGRSPLEDNRKFYVLSKLVPLVKDDRLIKATLIDALVNIEDISKENLIKEIQFFTLCTEKDDYIKNYAKESIEHLTKG